MDDRVQLKDAAYKKAKKVGQNLCIIKYIYPLSLGVFRTTFMHPNNLLRVGSLGIISFVVFPDT